MYVQDNGRDLVRRPAAEVVDGPEFRRACPGEQAA